MRMRDSRGFSLIEMLVAMTITVGTGAAVFNLFRMNERVFRDQSLLTEMQQAARVAAAEIEDDIRLAGQGVPVYSALYDTSPSEATALLLPGSDATRINLRAGLSNVESSVTNAVPFQLTLGSAAGISAGNASVFSTAVGTNPTGKYVYISGGCEGGTWGWVRARINSVAAALNVIQVTPEQGGSSGRQPGADGVLNTADDAIRFSSSPTIWLEESVAVYWDGNSNTLKRTTATNMSNPASPVWAGANDLAVHVTSLTFTYLDKSNNPIVPVTVAARAAVARVDVRLAVETQEVLSTGGKAGFGVSLRAIPRNARVR